MDEQKKAEIESLTDQFLESLKGFKQAALKAQELGDSITDYQQKIWANNGDAMLALTGINLMDDDTKLMFGLFIKALVTSDRDPELIVMNAICAGAILTHMFQNKPCAVPEQVATSSEA